MRASNTAEVFDEECNETNGTANELVERNHAWVPTIVMHVGKRFGATMDEKEELMQAASLGLVEAAHRFDAGLGQDFRSYAYFRVRGAIIDTVRRQSLVSRGSYAFGKELAQFKEEQAQRYANQRKLDLQREQTANLARRKTQRKITCGAVAYRVELPSEEQIADRLDAPPTPEALLEFKQDVTAMRRAFSKLSKMELRIVEGYYFEGLLFAEIAKKHRWPKSVVSKAHRRALAKLGRAIEEHDTPERIASEDA